MGMLLHRRRAEKKKPELPMKPVQEQEEVAKAEAATVKKPGRPKKSQ